LKVGGKKEDGSEKTKKKKKSDRGEKMQEGEDRNNN
jgi:hypothetical protein